MSLKEMLINRTAKKQKIEIREADNASDVLAALGLQDRANRLALGRFAINCVAWLIGGLVAKCEFRTYRNGKPFKGDEYYLWNVRPNAAQNSTQFLQEFVYKLCLKNEALIFSSGKELFCADSFTKQEYATKETVFTNVTRKDFTFTRRFSSSNAIYVKLNNTDAAQMVQGIQSGYDAMIAEATERYLKGGGEKLILKLSTMAEKDKNFEKKVSKYLNDYFKTYFESKNAVLPLFDGYDVDSIASKAEKKGSDEVNGIVQIKRESMDMAAQAYRVPPAIVRGDVADVSVLVENLLTFCIDPICNQIEEEINGVRYTQEEYLSGNMLSIDTTAIRHIDIFNMAANVDKLIASGFYSVDDAREKAGEARLNTKFSSEYVRTKNYAAEGGEVNAN